MACIGLLGVACSNSVKLTGNEFLIEGKLSGVEDGAVIYLYRMDDLGSIRWSNIASDTIKDGRFTFRSEAESNNEQFSIIPRGDGFPSAGLDVFAAPRAKIKIRGTGKLFTLWEVKSSVPYQKDANRYVNNSRDIIAEQARNSIERNDIMAKRGTFASEDEATAYRKILDSLNVIRSELIIKQLYNDISIMEKADITPIWIFKMRGIAIILNDRTGIYNLDAEQIIHFRKKAEELSGKMSEEYKNTPNGKYIMIALTQPRVTEVGEYMADAYLSDINGNTKNLADYLGKYLLLDFWNRACAPCIAALPEMREISETYRDKFTIISISLDADAAWKEATAAHDMPWVNLRDPKSWGGLAAAYGVTGIPNYVLISPEGIIVDKWAGYATEYLKQKVSENIGL